MRVASKKIVGGLLFLVLMPAPMNAFASTPVLSAVEIEEAEKTASGCSQNGACTCRAEHC
jgi:hypothetical protein